LSGLIAVVVDRLLAENDELGPLGLDDALQDLGDGERLGRRIVSCACCGPIETTTISVAAPFSFRRIASSTAISSNGFIDILTLARSTPDPSALTRILTL